PKYLAQDENSNVSYDYGEILLGTHPPGWKSNLGWESPLAISESQRSERMFAQSGWFTIHGSDIRPLEEIFAGRSDIIRKVDIPITLISKAKEFLEFA